MFREIWHWGISARALVARQRLRAAAALGSAIHAVVSRGGRPDLAGEALVHVKAPTLLIVGERDEDVLRLNEAAYTKLQCEKSLAVVPHHEFSQLISGAWRA